MRVLALSLIGIGVAINCCAIAFLLLRNRRRFDLEEKSFEKNLDEIERHFQKTRRERGDLS
jgi:hypothetical protein